MIQTIISPAKQMAIARDSFAPAGIPPFPEQTRELVDALRELEAKGPEALRALWGVSDKLLAENLERLEDFTHVPSPAALDAPDIAAKVGPAIFSYVGIQYRSMAPEVLGQTELEWLQDRLWVLSGLYGCIRPFDAVQPYRLEMGARLQHGNARNLYAFWGDRIARAVCADADAGLVNLASAEYSKAVLPHIEDSTIVATCVFSSSLRNGKPVQKSTESKMARGSMVRWMAENRIESVDELERFDVGFSYDSNLSSTQGRRRTLVFMRG